MKEDFDSSYADTDEDYGTTDGDRPGFMSDRTEIRIDEVLHRINLIDMLEALGQDSLLWEEHSAMNQQEMHKMEKFFVLYEDDDLELDMSNDKTRAKVLSVLMSVTSFLVLNEISSDTINDCMYWWRSGGIEVSKFMGWTINLIRFRQAGIEPWWRLMKDTRAPRAPVYNLQNPMRQPPLQFTSDGPGPPDDTDNSHLHPPRVSRKFLRIRGLIRQISRARLWEGLSIVTTME